MLTRLRATAGTRRSQMPDDPTPPATNHPAPPATNEPAPPATDEPARQAMGPRIAQIALTLVILYLVFFHVLPGIADWDEVAESLQAVTITTLVVALLFSLGLEALKAREQLLVVPLLRFWRAAVAVEITSLATSLVPGPSGTTARFVVYRSFGLSTADFARAWVVTSAFNNLLVLAMPALGALAVLAFSDQEIDTVALVVGAISLVVGGTLAILAGLRAAQRGVRTALRPRLRALHPLAARPHEEAERPGRRGGRAALPLRRARGAARTGRLARSHDRGQVPAECTAALAFPASRRRAGGRAESGGGLCGIHVRARSSRS